MLRFDRSVPVDGRIHVVEYNRWIGRLDRSRWTPGLATLLRLGTHQVLPSRYEAGIPNDETQVCRFTWSRWRFGYPVVLRTLNKVEDTIVDDTGHGTCSLDFLYGINAIVGFSVGDDFQLESPNERNEPAMLEEAGGRTDDAFEFVGGSTVQGAFQVVDAEVVVFEAFLGIVAGEKEYWILYLL